MHLEFRAEVPVTNKLKSKRWNLARSKSMRKVKKNFDLSKHSSYSGQVSYLNKNEEKK